MRTAIKQPVIPHSFSSYSNADCTSPSYEGCLFDVSQPLPTPLSSSASFSQCTFIKLTSSTNGGAISFTSDSPHTVRECFFRECSTVSYVNWQSGGGAVSSSAGSLSVYSSTFISCDTPGFGGAVLGTSNSVLIDVSQCLVFGCLGGYCGGGISAHYSSAADISSCRFLLCECNEYGGGYYHNNNITLPLKVSNSLFRKNTAKKNSGNRGGGGLED